MDQDKNTEVTFSELSHKSRRLSPQSARVHGLKQKAKIRPGTVEFKTRKASIILVSFYTNYL